jgi:hypothetical protein
MVMTTENWKEEGDDGLHKRRWEQQRTEKVTHRSGRERK